MRNVRVDTDGELRCWNCGSKSFREKRTARSKVAGLASAPISLGAGVLGTMVTKKKLKCHVCGEYNDVGNAKPYEGPASRKYRKREAKREDNDSLPVQQTPSPAASPQSRRPGPPTPHPPPPAPPSARPTDIPPPPPSPMGPKEES